MSSFDKHHNTEEDSNTDHNSDQNSDHDHDSEARQKTKGKKSAKGKKAPKKAASKDDHSAKDQTKDNIDPNIEHLEGKRNSKKKKPVKGVDDKAKNANKRKSTKRVDSKDAHKAVKSASIRKGDYLDGGANNLRRALSAGAIIASIVFPPAAVPIALAAVGVGVASAIADGASKISSLVNNNSPDGPANGRG